jgi:LuxR family maltose regulon positive regulatory protein
VHKREVLTQVRIFLAQQQYEYALDLLERFSEQLDRPGDITTTIRFLVISLLALHHAGKREQAAQVATRLFALTEPQGYIRLYLVDLGKPMKQVLLALQASSDRQTEQVVLSRFSIIRLISCF